MVTVDSNSVRKKNAHDVITEERLQLERTWLGNGIVGGGAVEEFGNGHSVLSVDRLVVIMVGNSRRRRRIGGRKTRRTFVGVQTSVLTDWIVAGLATSSAIGTSVQAAALLVAHRLAVFVGRPAHQRPEVRVAATETDQKLMPPKICFCGFYFHHDDDRSLGQESRRKILGDLLEE